MAKRVFLLYSEKDGLLRDELVRHLAPLERSGAAVIWHDGQLHSGDATLPAVEAQIDAADVILLLVTSDFFASDVHREALVQRSLARGEAVGARVVPVLVRPCVWDVGPLSKLEPLPKSREAVTSWPNRDEAWREVVRGVLALIPESAAPQRPGAQLAGGPSTASLPWAAKEATTSEPPVAPTETRVLNEVRILEEQLDGARRRREKLARVGVSEGTLRAVEAEVLELRRKLRERGQLAAGDALAKDRYLLVELLGKGGFATVWRAHDEQAGTEVAIKVLHPHLMRDETRRERFFRGARVMAGLTHPGIVRVLDAAGHDRGFDYFVMEFVRGGTLRDAVASGRVTGAAILDVLVTVGEALAAAHAAGHVHRDVKPANILVDEQGYPKLADFDLVGGDQTTGGTRTGVLGTIVYAAPEAMVNAADADARADVYGLGMTGVFCYHGKDLPPSVLRDVGRMIRGLSCPEEVRSALARATEWEVEERWADVAAFCEGLRARPRTSTLPVAPAQPVPAEGFEPASPAMPADVPRVAPLRLSVVGLQRSSHVLEHGPSKEIIPWAVRQGDDRDGRYASFVVGGVFQRMRWIAPGSFLMGSPESEGGRYLDEGPQHEVELSRGFWLAETPCTQALWEVVMGNNPSRFRTHERPVEQVSWEDCQAFIDRLNARMPDLGGRLPSEAEWEYACRGGTTTATWVGDLAIVGANHAPLLDAIAWYGGNSGVWFELDNGADTRKWPDKQYPYTYAGTHPVGKKLANPFGLHDMLGNVWEWCEDGARTYTSAPMIDPRGPESDKRRVIRGGSWGSDARGVRASLRVARTSVVKNAHIGFRLALGKAP